MVKRKCLNCGTVNYSADTISEYWICYQCGSKIPKTEEKSIMGREQNDDAIYNSKNNKEKNIKY